MILMMRELGLDGIMLWKLNKNKNKTLFRKIVE